MKINFLISSLSGGGAEKVLTTLAKEFANDGNDVAILSLEKRPQFYQVSDKVQLIKIDNTKKGKLSEIISDFYFIRKFLKERNADVSISFLSRCNLVTLVAQIGLREKVVVCDRNNPLREHSIKVFKLSCLIYRLATGISVQTEQIKSFYPKYLQKKIFVIENPIDMNSLKSQIDGIKVERQKIISSVGRLEPQKDFKTLIEAFSLIADRHLDWKVNIFGIGGMRDELQKMIEMKNLQNQVFLCGRTDKPYLELSKSQIFVLSSNYEGFPNVLCEAMFAGNACISSDCVSGPRELISCDENGFLFEVGDSKDLAEKLERLINDENLRKKFSDRAFETVQRLSVDNIFSRWKKELQELD